MACPGRLYVPADYTPTKTYPLVLFLHGGGEAGSDNAKQVNVNIDGLLAAAKGRGAFLYAPQSATGVWGTSDPGATLDVQKAIGMIDAAAQSYNISRDRLYLTGVSLGGGGTWDALANYPDTFAAGAPLCGTLGPLAYQPTLNDQPIWAFHSRDDPLVSVANTQNMFNAISTADGSPPTSFPPLPAGGIAHYADGPLRYTELATLGHSIWHLMYRYEPLYDWMFAQSVPEPGAAALAAPLVMLLLRRCARRT